MTGEETPPELAEAYAEALETREDGDEYDAAVEHLDALRTRLERFEESYGDSDPATEELREKVQLAEDKVSELEQQRRKPQDLERKLLEAARGFMLDEDWLQPAVIEALNRALTGESDTYLRIDDFELSCPEDAENLDDVARFDIIDVVRKLALDKLGKADDIGSIWQAIEGTTKEDAFRVVANTGRADPDDVVEAVDEDIGRSAARNRLKNAVYNLDISPYHREDGTYSLSTVGRYIVTEYVDASMPGGQESEEEDQSDDGQTMLGQELVTANGGVADE